MKTIKALIFLIFIFTFIGCASTQSASTVPENVVESAPEEVSDGQAEVKKTNERTETLIERYISGEIPDSQN